CAGDGGDSKVRVKRRSGRRRLGAHRREEDPGRASARASSPAPDRVHANRRVVHAELSAPRRRSPRVAARAAAPQRSTAGAAGPEYARYSALLELLDHLVSFGDTPEFRALLLPPGPARNELYSASTRYANALANELLPEAGRHAPSEYPLVLLGASLGALAAVHAHVRSPGLAGGLFLQSGSFFRRRFDAHEAGFPRFARITRF